MSITNIVIVSADSAAMILDQLNPQTGASSQDSLSNTSRYISGLADGAFYYNTVSEDIGATQATGTITFSSIAAGDTVTIGTTVYTGTNGTPNATQFQTNVTPSAAADKVAAASLASRLNTWTTLANTANTAIVNVTSKHAGSTSNFIPLAISAHGSVSGATLSGGGPGTVVVLS
jgi:hypothetical protein